VIERLRIAVVDRYPMFRDGVVLALAREKTFLVVAKGTTARDAVDCTTATKPDILLLEAAVPGSLHAIQTILRAQPVVKVIVLASTEDQDHVVRSIHAGVHGYIMKGISGTELIGVIKAVRSGERYITPNLAWHLIAKPTPLVTREAVRLSTREKQVLDYTVKGLTTQEIATALHLAASTIKYYKNLTFKKLGIRNRLEATVAMNKILNDRECSSPQAGGLAKTSP